MKKNYTFDDHHRIGEELYIMREKLLRLSCELGSVYGSKRKPSRLAQNIYEGIDELRNQLDNLVFKENPEFATRELADAYYCARRIGESGACLKI
ncbi:MAG: hypothetical protein RBR43_06780 [Desulfuromonadaceae bacterium]|nr:hypothetical protein [Desulfuromonadaceae bacterium]